MVSCFTERGFGDKLMVTLQGCIMALHPKLFQLLLSRVVCAALRTSQIPKLLRGWLLDQSPGKN